LKPSFAEVLQTNAVGYRLCVGWEVKMEVPVHRPRLKLSSAILVLEEGRSVQLVDDTCCAAKRIAEEMAQRRKCNS